MELDESYLKLIIQNCEAIKNMNKSIDIIQEELKNNRDLLSSVKEIVTEMKRTREDVCKIEARLGIIEKKPAQNYEDVKKTILNTLISLTCGGIIGSILSLILK